ncbi:nucleotidyltransferase family protein [Brucella oryzae]|uniref:nucleotidyltransferase family protein n=1 Tax=Brucella oryzae TaxID=335286 RepID=UPI001B8303B9|nr:nucleotidyltransferase family protein [Brucella oryzae]MBR7652229.1 nucleotidyltransferase family protein [Brucella oryzae]
MEDASTVAVLVLGAGLGSRFNGGDKLGKHLGGMPVAHYILSSLKPFNWGQRILVCRGAPQWTEAYAEEGFVLASRPDAESGMLGSIHRGLMEIAGQTHVLICLADMPLIPKEHMNRLLEARQSNPFTAIASRSHSYRGVPAIFPIGSLSALPRSGEGGARDLLVNAKFVDASDPSLFVDIDTAQDLELLQARCSSTGV